MKFTAFVLATAAASASAQVAYNPFMGAGNVAFNNGAFQPYAVQTPLNNVAQPYPIQVPQVVDPLAWERDCTWINSISFRQALSMSTCGKYVCFNDAPNGNGGGHHREAARGTKGYHVWGSVINRAGRVCAVAYTGNDLTQQFPYGRLLSMKLANTANSLSLPNRAAPSHVRHSYPNNNRGLIMNGAGNPEYATTANMNSLHRHQGDQELGEAATNQFNQNVNRRRVTPAGNPSNSVPGNAGQNQADNRWSIPLIEAGTNVNLMGTAPNTWNLGTGYFAESQWFGFTLPAEQFNPGNLDVHYQGATSNYGEACGTTRQDPMCMQKPGGFAYQAGGLPLYDQQGALRGAIGVAGDNDCTNHAIAWKAREQLGLNFTPCGVQDIRNDAFAAGSNAAAQALATASNWEVHWAGKAAEDNVIFSGREQYLFPGCQDIVRQFATQNPTKPSTFGTNACSK